MEPTIIEMIHRSNNMITGMSYRPHIQLRHYKINRTTTNARSIVWATPRQPFAGRSTKALEQIPAENNSYARRYQRALSIVCKIVRKVLSQKPSNEYQQRPTPVPEDINEPRRPFAGRLARSPPANNQQQLTPMHEGISKPRRSFVGHSARSPPVDNQ